MKTQRVNHSRLAADANSPRKERPAIFGLRYLEEEAAEIHDVVGCMYGGGTCTTCDDIDRYA